MGKQLNPQTADNSRMGAPSPRIPSSIPQVKFWRLSTGYNLQIIENTGKIKTTIGGQAVDFYVDPRAPEMSRVAALSTFSTLATLSPAAFRIFGMSGHEPTFTFVYDHMGTTRTWVPGHNAYFQKLSLIWDSPILGGAIGQHLPLSWSRSIHEYYLRIRAKRIKDWGGYTRHNGDIILRTIDPHLSHLVRHELGHVLADIAPSPDPKWWQRLFDQYARRITDDMHFPPSIRAIWKKSRSHGSWALRPQKWKTLEAHLSAASEAGYLSRPYMGTTADEFWADLFVMVSDPYFAAHDRPGNQPRHYLPFVVAIRHAINEGDTPAEVANILRQELTKL